MKLMTYLLKHCHPGGVCFDFPRCGPIQQCLDHLKNADYQAARVEILATDYGDCTARARVLVLGILGEMAGTLPAAGPDAALGRRGLVDLPLSPASEPRSPTTPGSPRLTTTSSGTRACRPRVTPDFRGQWATLGSAALLPAILSTQPKAQAQLSHGRASRQQDQAACSSAPPDQTER